VSRWAWLDRRGGRCRRSRCGHWRLRCRRRHKDWLLCESRHICEPQRHCRGGRQLCRWGRGWGPFQRARREEHCKQQVCPWLGLSHGFSRFLLPRQKDSSAVSRQVNALGVLRGPKHCAERLRQRDRWLGSLLRVCPARGYAVARLAARRWRTNNLSPPRGVRRYAEGGSTVREFVVGESSVIMRVHAP
jgi:hypothetical protein